MPGLRIRCRNAGSGLQGQFTCEQTRSSAPVFVITPVLRIPFLQQIRITRSVHCEQARSFCSCVNDFSGVADSVFTLMRGSGLEGQFTVNKQGLSAPVLMITPVLRTVSRSNVDADPYLYLKGWIRLHKL